MIPARISTINRSSCFLSSWKTSRIIQFFMQLQTPEMPRQLTTRSLFLSLGRYSALAHWLIWSRAMRRGTLSKWYWSQRQITMRSKILLWESFTIFSSLLKIKVMKNLKIRMTIVLNLRTARPMLIKLQKFSTSVTMRSCRMEQCMNLIRKGLSSISSIAWVNKSEIKRSTIL